MANISTLGNQLENYEQKFMKSRNDASAFFNLSKEIYAEVDDFYNKNLNTNQQEINSEIENLINNNPQLYAGWDNRKLSDLINDENFENSDIDIQKVQFRIGTLKEERSQTLSLPYFIDLFNNEQSLLITGDERKAQDIMISVLLRSILLLPHKIKYMLLDPGGMGQAFPMRKLMEDNHLPLYENDWDMSKNLTAIERDIDQFFRNSRQMGQNSFFDRNSDGSSKIEEKIKMIFISNFPDQFSDRRVLDSLNRISRNGPKAGVFLVVQHNPDPKYSLPRDYYIDNIFENCLKLDLANNQQINNQRFELYPDKLPSPIEQTRIIENIKETKPTTDIDWDTLKLDENEWWKKTAVNSISAPVGYDKSNQELRVWFGEESGRTCAHGILAATTGGGKSNFFHVLICQLATHYSPEEINFYLIDGKDGVEFRDYEHLPHVKVISLKTSPDLARSVLEDLLEEKNRRNALFQKLGVNDYKSYRAKTGDKSKLPRILLLIDEYQQLFENDREGVGSMLIKNLSQQGRSAGIHMLLSSQRFRAAGMLHQADIFQNIHLRMALKMSQDDIKTLTEFEKEGRNLIKENDIAGKIVLNDDSGKDYKNKPGKILAMKRKNAVNSGYDGIIEEVTQKLKQKAQNENRNIPRIVVFNGKEQPEFLNNPHINTLLKSETWLDAEKLEQLARKPLEDEGFNIPNWTKGENPRIAWTGQEFNVHGFANVIFRRNLSENAMVIGNYNTERYGIISSMLTSLALNVKPPLNEFIIYDYSTLGTDYNKILSEVNSKILTPAGFDVKYYNRQETTDIEALLDELINKIKERKALTEMDLMSQSSVFAVFTELENLSNMRRSESSYNIKQDSETGKKLKQILNDGPSVSIHTILSFQSVKAMTKVIDERRTLNAFRHRIALQLNAEESFNYIKSRDASKLNPPEFPPPPVKALYTDVELENSSVFKPYSCNNEVLTEDLNTIGEKVKKWRDNL